MQPEQVDAIVHALLVALRDEQPKVRKAAVISLFCNLFDYTKPIPNALPPNEAILAGLLEAMTDKEQAVRHTAALTFSHIYFIFGRTTPAPPLPKDLERFAIVLSQALEDSDPEVRVWASQALVEAAPRLDRPPPAALVALLDSSERATRTRAIESIVKFPQGIDPLVPAILKALERDDLRAHNSCFGAIFLFLRPSPDSLSALKDGLRSPERHVRFMAAHLISRIGPPASAMVPAILPLLNEGYDPRVPFESQHPEHDDPAVSATWALGAIAPGTPMAKMAEDGLTKLLANPERPWRHADARSALEKIQGEAEVGEPRSAL